MKLTKDDRCVYCSYQAQVISRGNWKEIIPSPRAVEIVETPNGPRALCEQHARDAVRA